MLGAGSIEHRELIYYTVSKSTTFEPPRSGLDPASRMHLYSFEASKLKHAAQCTVHNLYAMCTGTGCTSTAVHDSTSRIFHVR